MYWQQLSSDLCWNSEHVHLEIGALGLDTGNVTMIVDIATTHLDIFLMMDTKIHWWFGRFHIFLRTTATHGYCLLQLVINYFTLFLCLFSVYVVLLHCKAGEGAFNY